MIIIVYLISWLFFTFSYLLILLPPGPTYHSYIIYHTYHLKTSIGYTLFQYIEASLIGPRRPQLNLNTNLTNLTTTDAEYMNPDIYNES
jgi:hypothetical protein